jgi:membrane protein DedA with SNARE-associated domain
VNAGHLIAVYGYWAVFALVAGESLGVPLPGETALIVAGTYAGTTHHLSPWLIFAVAAAAVVTRGQHRVPDRGQGRLPVRPPLRA